MLTINENEIYESLRISTVFSGHTFITTGEPGKITWNDKKDDEFFSDHPKRRFLLRVSNSGEFDAPAISGMNTGIPAFRIVPPISKALEAVYQSIPPLWALVSRIHPKRHVVTAVYRGSAYFATQAYDGRVIAVAEDDCAVAAILQTMSMRCGIDGHEWNAFVRKYHATVAAMSGNTTNKVN
jgi:hypothetical protein